MRMPPPRGELSEWLGQRLTGHTAPVRGLPRPTADASSAYADDDLQLALWCCYELHYRGFDDVQAEAEWDLEVLRFRSGLEHRWIECLQLLCSSREVDLSLPAAQLLRQVIDADDAPALSRYLQRHASREQLAEFVRNRSVYQLKEADPHTFGIPRLDAQPKAALVEIQADEYGSGHAARMHAELFRDTMRWLGLSDDYGHYVPAVPAVTLAMSNLMSLFALHRRWLPALLGHLAVFEMTSTEPSRRYAAGIRRLGGDDLAARYFDEHVEADAVHEQIAAHDLCGSYLRVHPSAAADLAFGATACVLVDGLFAEHLLTTWGVHQPALNVAP